MQNKKAQTSVMLGVKLLLGKEHRETFIFLCVCELVVHSGSLYQPTFMCIAGLGGGVMVMEKLVHVMMFDSCSRHE